MMNIRGKVKKKKTSVVVKTGELMYAVMKWYGP
jgi:hypothetical protein